MMRAFTWMAGAILASGCGAAVALTPQDFAFGVPVVTSKDAAVYRIALPLSVYQNTVRDDLGDLRLFNSQNEAVPYSLLRPKPAAQARAGAATLPLFPLRGSSRVVIDGVRLTIDSAGSAVNLQTQRESGINIAVNQYILDGRGFEAAVSALRLVWPETASDYSGRLRIEVSDDLGSWVTLVVGAPIANLHANGQSLVENRVAIPPTRTKFWRISWLGPSPMFELTSVLAEPADGPAESVRATLDITGVPDPADPDAYLFDTGAHLPVSRVNLSLPETNMVNGIELSSRRAPPNPWRTVAYAGFYRIKTHEGEQQNAPIDISIDRDRYWRAKITRGGARGSLRCGCT